MRAAVERERRGKGHVKHRASRPVVGGPPELPWKVKVVDSQGNLAEVQLVPVRVEPAAVTVQVPVEWVNEAVRRMLALENVVRRAASGMPLELRYPASTSQAIAPRRIQVYKTIHSLLLSMLTIHICSRYMTCIDDSSKLIDSFLFDRMHRDGRLLKRERDLHQKQKLLHLWPLHDDKPGAHSLSQQAKRQPRRWWRTRKSGTG
ncbi:hypothetical protein RHMOL_Rhmol04G0204300 [Rhododendron molle]|uniref:Uncharacterized protein n=1 Tax=Rhododendron molle TaxID=49168 RepID=A0ACC0P4B0_RHOML|nr:hypothetical protein RHMOL_Rhmol04G0204300 [Rhododendron molle]